MDEARIGNLGAAEIQVCSRFSFLRCASPVSLIRASMRLRHSRFPSPFRPREPGIADRRREVNSSSWANPSRYLTPVFVTAV